MTLHQRSGPSRTWTGLAVLTLLALAGVACGDDPTPGIARAPTSTEASTSTTQLSDVTVSAPSTSTPPATLRCETVGFTPNSEDAASEITATGLSCDEAEAFVRVAGTRTSSGGPDQLEVSGYRCVRTGSEEDPLPVSHYECTNGAKKVTFLRS